DARWTRAVADQALACGQPVRLVTVVDATTSAGRSRAQAATQLARAGAKATRGLVAAFTVSAESSEFPIGFVEHLICGESATDLAGAELVATADWFGIRSHPRPAGSIAFGGPAVPLWFDDVLGEVVSPR